jgi:hypothetical protein
VVDLLVFAGNPSQPLTLFENKRQIRDHVELQRAVDQAHGYALALRVRSLVVMDASQLWIYQIHQGSPVLAQQVAIAQLEQHDQHVRDLLLALGPVFDPIEAF